MRNESNLSGGSAISALAPDNALGTTEPTTKPKKNANLAAARKTKNDEFYTRLEDIDKELAHYTDHFKGQVVFCNCDDPSWSNFWRYFHLNFDALGLKRLVSTYYAKNGGQGGLLVCRTESRDAKGRPIVQETPLQGDGDFRSGECVALLKEADIVCTNPPFSLFRQYIDQLIEHEKKFLVIGNMNAITYQEIFPRLKDNLMWLGVSSPKSFRTHKTQETYKKFGNICWFTNLSHNKRTQKLKLFSSYQGNESRYPKYDNFDAIEVGEVKDIPMDWEGWMGVPKSFFFSYNPDQFEVLGVSQSWNKLANKTYEKQTQISFGEDGKTTKKVTKLNDAPAIVLSKAPVDETHYLVNGVPHRAVYARIFIKRK